MITWIKAGEFCKFSGANKTLKTATFTGTQSTPVESQDFVGVPAIWQ